MTTTAPQPFRFDAYRITMRHDCGIVHITTHAQDEQAARRIVLIAERAPERSILKVKRLTPKPRRIQQRNKTANPT